ncbi:MAG TPA: hypothetical protein VGA22_07280 [Gemmatimonadales bacterium]
MNDMLAVYAAALVLGATHALEVDHMVAVNAFLGNRPRVASAVGYGIRWALGHSIVIVGAGSALAISGLVVPTAFVEAANVCVGAVLIGLGAWAFRATHRLHVHTPADHGDHAHLHVHAPGSHPHRHGAGASARHHRHLSTVVGAAHGLAGTAPVTALVPVTLLAGFWGPFAYLLVFAVGTIVAMAAYAGLAAVAVRRLGSSVRAARSLAGLTAGGSVVVGVWWIVRVFLPA